MKIYIVTCNNAYNYGAVLQAYALQTYIEKYGHDVKIIDFYPKNLRKISEKYRKNVIFKIIRAILYYPDYKKSAKVFGDFARSFLNLTSPCHNIVDINNLPLADLYIAGSDQIWNPVIGNAFEDAYFLNLNKKINKISYAASIGLKELDNEYISYLKSRLKDFDAISVREEVTNIILNDIGINSVNVIDPVYLLSSKEWIKNLRLKKKNPVVATAGFLC